MNKKKPKIIIAWWGALEGGGPTAGDVLSVRAVENLFLEKQCLIDIAVLDKSKFCTDFFSNAVDWHTVDSRCYDVLLFVCGPIIKNSESLQELLKKFENCTRIAVGVTILPKFSSDYWNPFDICLARDGLPDISYDVALAFPLQKFQKKSFKEDRRLGLCLRGNQREYGLDSCLHHQAEILCRNLIKQLNYKVFTLETRLDRTHLNTDSIDRSFERMNIVVTTRLHGALLALRHGVPVLALDQIVGGGKLSSVLKNLGWRYVFRVEETSVEMLLDASYELLSIENHEYIESIGILAKQQANNTLNRLWNELTQKANI